MTKFLIATILLATILVNFCVFAQNKNATDSFQATDANSPSSTSLTLTWQSSGYYIPVKIQNDDIDILNLSGNEREERSNMMLALYSSITLLAENCLSFSPILASEDQNSLVNDIFNLDYPYFTVKSGFSSPFQIDLSSNYPNDQEDAIVATSCSQQGPSAYGSESFGLLGMGIDNNALNNNSTLALFSIYLDGPEQNGKLFFTTDFSNTQSHTPVSTLTADADWHVFGVSSLKIGPVSYHTSSTNLIFDINSNMIGLPLKIFETVISSLESVSSVTCPANTYSNPTCTYPGHIVNLPNIVIGVEAEQIVIPPVVYATSGTANTVSFNLRGLNSNMSDINYITPSYNSYIILDSNFMSYYYTVFAASPNGGTITLYAALQTEDNTSTIVFIVLGFIVLLIFLISRCGCKKKKNKLNQTSESAKEII